ncbi:PLxRFG domain-containing protein [Mesorhizobium huakuii]|uniref:PLxRFG domain-containing protein n=2 Tax=Mesorhizobium huakuii TaxID=28104 RepID=A0A7G6T3Y2_9HYPH|nr:PLxRFG domain-containing protein [Mesorhizobium huakuii]
MVASNEARRDQAARMSAKEIEAEAFGLWAAGLTKVKPHTVLKAGWERMAKMVRQIHNLLAGRGFQTSEDVFGAAKAGDIAQRFPKGFTGSTAPSFQLAYHGTPHAFDRFSTAKIGTGEGFQSFGWGLYFASLKDVAETYRQMLARDGGQVIKVDVPENSELMLWDKPLDEQPPAVKRALRSMVDVVKKPGIFSREPEKTFRAITREVLAGKDWHSTTGGQLYGMLARRLGKGDANQQAASKALLQAGIPGHRYLDAGSRADGDGSYNYVVYDDGRVSMLDSDIALPERTHFQENDDGFDADAADASYSLTENRIVNEVKGRFTDFTPSALAAIPLNYFTELARPSMTAVGEYLRVKRFLDAYRGKKHAAADVIAQQWLKYARLGLGKAGKAKAAILAQLMHDATLAGADPSQTDDETVNKPGYSALRATWLSLSPAGKELFSTVRDAYVDQANELDSILLDNVRKAQEISRRKAEEAYNAEIERINAAKMQPMAKADALREATETYKSSSTRSVWSAKARLTKMRLAFEASRVPTPYFPLARFGRYFVTVRDVDGTVLSFSRRERSMDRDILAGDMRDAFPTAKVEVGVVENVNEMRQAMDPRMVAEIEEIVGGAGFDSATMTNVMDQIWQRYLQTMPDLSARKRFIHRKGVHGFDSDALRSFSSHMFHAGHQMGRLKYGHELQELTNEASDQARKSDDPTKGMTLANELRLRHKWVMNPTGSSVAQVMSSAAFVWYLGATPAAAIVNMTQTPMIGIPVLAGKYGGFAKASAAVLKAAFDSVVGKGSVQRANLTKEELAALDNFYESGLIDRTQSHDLAGVGDTGVRYSPLKAKVMGILSWAFHRTEVWNREVTALAAFRLAKAAGEDFTQAVDSAHDLTWKTHFDYSNSSRPRMMQNDFAKVALVFRAYNINMLYRVFRDIHQAIKGETAQARKEARYQAAGVVGMMSLLGGVTGVIGFNTMMMLASAVLGDDDDPMDFEQQFKKDMLDILGPQLGGVVLNGVPGHYLGIDLTSRIGMPDLWFRSPTKDLQGKNEFDYWVMNSLGASVSMIGQAFQGISLIGEGKVERGVETMAPKWMRDLMKSYRYLNEGVTNLKGDEIMSADQIKPWDIIAQSIGFTPAKISETYDRNSALQNAESRVQQQRQQLVNRFALASRMGDMDGRADALAAIKVFNKVPLHRSMPITIDTLHQSLKTRDRNDKKREDGVLIENRPLGKKLRAMLPDRVY